jgi:hypothetical protein
MIVNIQKLMDQNEVGSYTTVPLYHDSGSDEKLIGQANIAPNEDGSFTVLNVEIDGVTAEKTLGLRFKLVTNTSPLMGRDSVQLMATFPEDPAKEAK